MRIQLFIIAWSTVGGLTVAYLLAGAVGDIVHKAVEQRRQRVLDVLSILLFESDVEAEAVHQLAGKLPKRALLGVIQTLAFDIEGQARERLENLVRTRGLDRHIRQRARSQRWRLRVQAAQLHYLLEDTDIDRASLLRDRHPLVRARAVESMTPSQAERFIPELLVLLAGSEPAVCWAAKQSLLGIGSRVVPELVRFLAEVEPGMGLEALEVAANLPDPRLAEVLRGYCAAEDPRARRMALTALSTGRGEGAEELLAQALRDPEEEVRVAALEGLDRLGAVAAVSTVGRLLRDPSWFVRRAAGSALDNLGASGHLMLRRYLTDLDPFARDMARRVIDAREAQARGPVDRPGRFSPVPTRHESGNGPGVSMSQVPV